MYIYSTVYLYSRDDLILPQRLSACLLLYVEDSYKEGRINYYIIYVNIPKVLPNTHGLSRPLPTCDLCCICYLSMKAYSLQDRILQASIEQSIDCFPNSSVMRTCTEDRCRTMISKLNFRNGLHFYVDVEVRFSGRSRIYYFAKYFTYRKAKAELQQQARTNE